VLVNTAANDEPLGTAVELDQRLARRRRD